MNIDQFNNFTGKQFYKARLGQNCPVNNVIASAESCKEALQSLDLRISNLDISKTDRPAGCYCSDTGGGFFNSFISPSSTYPTDFGNRAGVCIRPGNIDNYSLYSLYAC